MSFLEALTPQASGRPTRGRTPIYRVMINGELEDMTVQEATFAMGEGLHDTGSMSVSSTVRTNTDGLLDAPISFLYGLAPRTETFCGYVTSVTESQSDSGVLSWKMEVMGPTKNMQIGQPRFWSNKTIPSTVENLSYLGYLGYSGHNHDYLWPTLAQTGDTDWKTACQFASRLGWSLFNRYGIVLCYDPLILFRDQGAAATLISESYDIALTNVDSERVLLEFDPSEDSEDSVDQQGLKVAYFSDEGVQVASQQGDHTSYEFVPNFVIRDAEEASIYVNGSDSDASDWRQHGMARIMGNASLFPGLTVDVLTTNPKYYRGKFNGRWLILAVQHSMDRQTFQSNLALVRPDSTTEVNSGAYEPFWQTAGKARPTLTAVDTDNDSEVTKMQWMSSWTNPSVRAVM